MLAVALNFDKYIFIPVVLITAIATGKAFLDAIEQDYNNFYTDPNSILRSNCQDCAELWFGFASNASVGPDIKIDNATLYFERYRNVAPCEFPTANAQYYVDISLQNASISNNTRAQVFGFIASIKGNVDHILYRTRFMWAAHR